MSVFSLHEDTHDHAEVRTGQQSSVATVFAQLWQKRAYLHGTSANASRGATFSSYSEPFVGSRQF